MRSPSSKITNRQLAAEAGLSEATVSLVMNNRAQAIGIKASTRRRVLEIAKRHNYVPNPLARGLNGKATRSVGIIWSLGEPDASGFVRELTKHIWNRKYVAFIADAMSDNSICQAVLAEYDRRGIDGIIFRADQQLLGDTRIIEHLKQFRAAVVSVPHPVPPIGLDLIIRNEEHGVVEVMEYWRRTGRKRPCILGNANTLTVTSWSRAMREQCQANGWPHEDCVVDIGAGGQIGRYFEHYQASLGRHFPDGKFPYDAVLCAGDDGAAAITSWLKKQGTRVPEDVSVVGFGNLDIVKGFDPPLASVERHLEQAVEAIEAMLFERLEHPDVPAQHRIIPSTFIWRESAGREIVDSGNTDGSKSIHGAESSVVNNQPHARACTHP